MTSNDTNTKQFESHYLAALDMCVSANWTLCLHFLSSQLKGLLVFMHVAVCLFVFFRK